MPTIHIESKKDEISNIVLMPGDPKRSEYIAKKYLKEYKLVNSVRGMTAYTGYYKDKLITIFPSGMGCPSMGIYSYELYNEYDVDTIIRIGSCGGYNHKLKLNDVILVTGSYSESNYYYELTGKKDRLIESNILLNNLIDNVAKKNDISLVKGNIYCSDAFYEKRYNFADRQKEKDVLGVEMETYALFANARKFNKKATALLTVSDLFFSDKKLTSEEREKKMNNMIVIALESCLKI